MHLVPPAYCYTVGSFRMSRVRIGTVTERTERTAVRRKQDGSRWLTSRWLTSACHHPAGRSSRDVSPYEMCHLTRPPRPNACQTSALLPPPTTSPISARTGREKSPCVLRGLSTLTINTINTVEYRASLLYSRARLSLQSHQGSSLLEIRIMGSRRAQHV